MREFDIFVPLTHPTGKPVAKGRIEALKKRLLRRSGGVTYFPQSNEGLWKVGSYTFRDKIVIFRIIAPGGASSNSFFRRLKQRMERDWQQQDVLILNRAVKLL